MSRDKPSQAPPAQRMARKPFHQITALSNPEPQEFADFRPRRIHNRCDGESPCFEQLERRFREETAMRQDSLKFVRRR